MVFEDFDSDLVPGWTFTYPAFPTPLPGSHTGKSQGFGNGQAISYTLQKNAQAANYIFSIWMKCGSGTSLSLALSGGGTYSATLTLPNTGGAWQYFQKTLPLSAITTATFTPTATLTSTAGVGIDDILFYPQNAEAATYSYDPITHFKVAATNTNGISAYYTNDAWGRLLTQYDQDKNMVQRKTYVLPGTAPAIRSRKPLWWRALL